MTMAAATAAASKLKKGPEAGPAAPEVPTEIVVSGTSHQQAAQSAPPPKPKNSSSGGMKLQKKEPNQIDWDAIVPETKEASEDEGNGWGKGVKLTFALIIELNFHTF